MRNSHLMTTTLTKRACNEARAPEPRCLGQVGVSPRGNPIFTLERPDGCVVEVVVPGRDEE